MYQDTKATSATRMLLFSVILAAAAAANTEMILAHVGNSQLSPDAYAPLVQAVINSLADCGIPAWGIRGRSSEEVKLAVASMKVLHPNAKVLYSSHGMSNGGGGVTAQQVALDDEAAIGVVMLSGFLTRMRRVEMRACLASWAVQPVHTPCPQCKLSYCVGGCLSDGVHNCSSSPVSSPSYPLSTLTIGGELDGVVRVARIAESWYTQRALPQHSVALVSGMNHADLSNGTLPVSIASRDLPSELGPSAACARVAILVAAFVEAQLTPARSLMADRGAVWPSTSAAAILTEAVQAAEAFFKPFEALYVEQEGSWWWTAHADESGRSAWAAHAQQLMAEPLPEPLWGATPSLRQWEVDNEFHLLSDESGIPPYYRLKHRAHVALAANGTLVSTNVAQLRYVELTPHGTGTVRPPLISANGWDIIKEEKAGVLSAIVDDGAEYTSAIEIATKLASRQFVANLTGAQAPASLDGGSRCMAINQAAWELALSSSSDATRRRFSARGRPLRMVPDKTPTPNGGPWFIWNYLQFREAADGVTVQSWSSCAHHPTISIGSVPPSSPCTALLT